MKFKVGDKVKLRNNMQDETIIQDIILTIKYINGKLVAFEEIEPEYKWQGIGVEGKLVEKDKEYSLDRFELVKPNKANIIRKIETSHDIIIQYDIKNLMIKFNVIGKIHIVNLLKILLHETKLYEYEYTRVSPFKLERKYIFENMNHVWLLDFINIKTLENIRKEIIKCDKDMKFEGYCEMFIPDFLELCVERNLLQRVDRGYKLIKKIDKVMDHCEYIKGDYFIYNLIQKGYVIPNKYKDVLLERYSLRA